MNANSRTRAAAFNVISDDMPGQYIEAEDQCIAVLGDGFLPKVKNVIINHFSFEHKYENSMDS